MLALVPINECCKYTIWTNDSIVYWRLYRSLGRNEFIQIKVKSMAPCLSGELRFNSYHVKTLNCIIIDLYIHPFDACKNQHKYWLIIHQTTGNNILQNLPYFSYFQIWTSPFISSAISSASWSSDDSINPLSPSNIHIHLRSSSVIAQVLPATYNH